MKQEGCADSDHFLSLQMQLLLLLMPLLLLLQKLLVLDVLLNFVLLELVLQCFWGECVRGWWK